MATGAAVQAKIKAVLARLNATPRVVKLRETTQTTGNPLLGIGTVVVTDTTVSPQPAAELVRAEEVTGSGGLLQPGDWRFIFDGTIAESQLRTKQILFGNEVLTIVHVEPYALQGVTVGYSVIGRTVTTRT